MEPDVFRGRLQVLPLFTFFDKQLAPEGVNELKPDRDVTHQLAALVIAHGEPILGELVFPKFPGVMKEDSRGKQVLVQLRIKRRESAAGPHHLRSMLNESTAARVMIIASRGSRAKPITKVR